MKFKPTDWIKALRSGKYKQSKGYLRYNNEYCSLGVLCEISKINKEKMDSGIWKYDNHLCTIPKSLNKDIQIRSESEFMLSSMNDEGISFKEIANYIEQNWENL